MGFHSRGGKRNQEALGQYFPNVRHNADFHAGKDALASAAELTCPLGIEIEDDERVCSIIDAAEESNYFKINHATSDDTDLRYRPVLVKNLRCQSRTGRCSSCTNHRSLKNRCRSTSLQGIQNYDGGCPIQPEIQIRRKRSDPLYTCTIVLTTEIRRQSDDSAASLGRKR